MEVDVLKRVPVREQDPTVRATNFEEVCYGYNLSLIHIQMCIRDRYLTMDWSSGWYLYSFFGNTGLDFGVNDDGVTNHCNWNARCV